MRKNIMIEKALREITELRKLNFHTKEELDYLSAASTALKQYDELRKANYHLRAEKRAAAQALTF